MDDGLSIAPTVRKSLRLARYGVTDSLSKLRGRTRRWAEAMQAVPSDIGRPSGIWLLKSLDAFYLEHLLCERLEAHVKELPAATVVHFRCTNCDAVMTVSGS